MSKRFIYEEKHILHTNRVISNYKVCDNYMICGPNGLKPPEHDNIAGTRTSTPEVSEVR